MGKPVIARSVIEALDVYCRKSNARVLKRLGLCLGATLGQNKREFRSGILSQAASLEKLRSKRIRDGEASITAIDVGISNFSYSVFKWNKAEKFPILMDWKKINLSQKFLEEDRPYMTMDPTDTWQVGRGLLEMFTNELPISDMYTLEKQRARSLSSKNVLQSVLLCNVIEHVLFSNLKNKQFYDKENFDYIVHSSSPQKMAQYWCDLKSLKTLHNRYSQAIGLKNVIPLDITKLQDKQTAKTSKLIRINLVKTILKNAIVPENYQKSSLSPRLKTMVEEQLNSKQHKKFSLFDCISSDSELGTKKDDDLADSFLHGLSWVQWLNTYENVAEIVMKNRGVLDDDILHEFSEYCMSLQTEWTVMSPKMKGDLAELNPKSESKDSKKTKDSGSSTPNDN